MRRPRIVVLDGITGAGKSEILAYAKEHPTRSYLVPTKLTTRPRRSTDNSWEFSFATAISDSSDLIVWSSVGNLYAVHVETIQDAIRTARIPILVCTESTGIVALLRNFDVAHVYVFRPMSRNGLSRMLERRGTPARQHDRRIEEHDFLEQNYVKKLSTITATLLNIGDLPLLRHQFDVVMSRIQDNPD